MDQTSRHRDGTILVSGNYDEGTKEEDKSEEKANNKDYNEEKYKKSIWLSSGSLFLRRNHAHFTTRTWWSRAFNN